MKVVEKYGFMDITRQGRCNAVPVAFITDLCSEIDLCLQPGNQIVHGHQLLLHGVAVADSDLAGLGGVEVSVSLFPSCSLVEKTLKISKR